MLTNGLKPSFQQPQYAVLTRRQVDERRLYQKYVNTGFQGTHSFKADLPNSVITKEVCLLELLCLISSFEFSYRPRFVSYISFSCIKNSVNTVTSDTGNQNHFIDTELQLKLLKMVLKEFDLGNKELFSYH